MDYDLDEYLEEYDDFTRNVSGSDSNSFNNRLDHWLHHLYEGEESVRLHMEWLERAVPWSKIQETVFSRNGGMGSEALTLPLDKYERLSVQLQIFRHIASNDLKLIDFIRDYYFSNSNRNLGFSLQSMIEKLFDPFSKELRRYIKRVFDTPVPDDVIAKADQVPASDRIVTINHNQPEFFEVLELLASVKEDIRGQNRIDPEIRERALSELAASQEILNAKSARYEVLKTLFFDGLKWLAKTLIGTTAETIVTRLITAAALLLGFPIG